MVQLKPEVLTFVIIVTNNFLKLILCNWLALSAKADTNLEKKYTL